jgi:type I restriction enzyme R subunit
MIAVTVDLLTTGVDIPDLEYLVLLRPVKSRILFERMLGRGTRKGERHRDKTHFTVFDCFDGTLLEYFRKTTGITEDLPSGPVRTLHEIVEEIWQNRDTAYNVGCLAKRLQRFDKALTGEAREALAAWIPDGDLARFARDLPRALRQDYAGTMKLLRDEGFQEALLRLPGPDRTFLKATEYQDTVTSAWMVRDADGQAFKPEDYLAAFSRFVVENQDRITAIRILLDRPRDWGATALSELRQKLAAARQRFTVENLQKAHEMRHRKALVDIISRVKHVRGLELNLHPQLDHYRAIGGDTRLHIAADGVGGSDRARLMATSVAARRCAATRRTGSSRPLPGCPSRARPVRTRRSSREDERTGSARVARIRDSVRP